MTFHCKVIIDSFLLKRKKKSMDFSLCLFKMSYRVAEHWPGSSAKKRPRMSLCSNLSTTWKWNILQISLSQVVEGAQRGEVKIECIWFTRFESWNLNLSLLQTGRNNSRVPLGSSFAMKLSEKIAESLKFLSNYTGDEWRDWSGGSPISTTLTRSLITGSMPSVPLAQSDSLKLSTADLCDTLLNTTRWR